jgi:uncharacterized protein YybS (DUF2232 family)
LTRDRILLFWFLCLSALLLLYFGGHLNPLGFLLAGVLMPLPVFLAGWGLGARAGLLLAAAAAGFIFSLKPGWATISQNLGFGELLIMGVLLGLLHRRDWPSPRAIIFTVAALSLTALLVLSGQAFFQGISPKNLLAQKSAEIMQVLNQVLSNSGGDSASLWPASLSPADMEALLRRLLPGLAITNTGLVAWLNVILARQLAVPLGWGAPAPPLSCWSTPEWLIFAVLGTGFLLLPPVSWLRTVCLNLLLVLALLYFCQGVAVISAWFHRFQLPRLLRVVGYPLLFLNPLFVLIITLGLMDLWLDFRRLHQPRDARGGDKP